MFSSCRGHLSEWSLSPVGEQDPEEIISFVPFSQSVYQTDEIIKMLESKGYHGDSVLVSGIGTGFAIVNVKLVDPVWKAVEPSSVKLLIVENLMIRPASEVYITPFSVIHYQLERIKHGHSEVIPMPSNQYYFELTNETVARLDHASSQVKGLVIGYTQIVVQDKNTLEHLSAIKPSSGIHVVYPHHLGFSVAPGNNWVLEVGRQYEISVKVFDKLGHVILIEDSIHLSTDIPSSHFTKLSSSINGSYHHVSTMKDGVVKATSSLNKLKDPSTGEEVVLTATISKQQTIEIFPPIKVIPSLVVLLWQPTAKYRRILKATGGSGSYKWSSQSDLIAGVNSQGVVTMVSKGTTVVRATDARNSLHYNETKVHVIPADTMSFLPSVVMVMVGHVIQLPVKIGVHIDKKLHLFSDCRQAAITIATSDPSVFNVKHNGSVDLTSLPSEACTLFVAMATKPGHTQVVLRLNSGGVSLETSVTIAAYPPLKPIDPESIAVLSLGSSKVVTFHGGPLPWILDRSGYYEDGVTNNEEGLRIQPISSSQQQSGHHKFYVVCRQLRAQILTVTVGNKPTKNNKFPANETSSVTISCDLPVTMMIKPAVPLPVDCLLLPATLSDPLVIPVYGGHQLELELTVFNDDGLEFDNFTSLGWEWSPADHTHLSVNDNIVHHRNHAIVTVLPGNQLGSIILIGSCDHHQHDYITNEGISFEDPFSPGVNYSITIQIIAHHHIEPDHVVVFNHHDNQVTMAIMGGSGYFKVVDHLSQQPVAKIQFDQKNQSVTAVPLRAGEITIAIKDSCLPSSKKAEAVLVVSDVHSIDVTMATKVKLDHSIQAVVKVIDCNGQPFSSKQLDHMTLLPHPHTAHITVKRMLPHPIADIANQSAAFQVHGVAIGTTQLSFNVTTRTGQAIPSRSCDLQVYSDLRLSPRVMTLLPGACGQISWTGGPAGVDVVFSIGSVAIATVNSTGLVEGVVPGNTTVTGQAQERDLDTNDIIVYSEDTIVIQVVQLTGVKIWLPSSQLLEDTTVSIRAHGVNGETPFAFAGVTKQLKFRWTAGIMNIQSLSSVYVEGGVSLVEEGAPIARLHARQPGVGVVQVTMECSHGICVPGLDRLSDELQVTVLPRLQLLYPSNCGHLLLPSNGVAKIQTNRDGMSKMSYKLLSASNQFRSIIVTSSGEVQAGSSVGHAVVMVTSHELNSGFNQSVMAHVEVQPIKSLSLMPLSLTHAPPTNKEYLFPLGYTVQFVVNLHDNHGRTMANVPVNLDHTVHRNDIVDVSSRHGNNTLAVKATKPGQVILKVWLSGQPMTSDYIHISVGYAIIPSLAVSHVGTRMCFMTHLTEERQGDWSSGDSSVVAIDTLSGVAVAKSTGRTAIYHKIRDVIDTHTEVTVAKIHNITVTNGNQLGQFTNVMTSQPYHVMITFHHDNSHHGNGATFTPLITSPHLACVNGSGGTTPPTVYIQQIGFDCVLSIKSPTHPQISQSDVSSAVSVFDNTTGTSYCHLVPTNNKATLRLLSSINDITMTLQVRAYDFTQSYEVFSELVRIPFVPAFVLSSEEVLLGSCDASAKVEVWGTPQQLNNIQVSSHDHTLIVAPPLLYSTKAVYSISQSSHVNRDVTPTTQVLYLTSSLTGQSVQLSVMSPSSSCASQSDLPVYVSPSPSATPTSELHKLTFLQEILTILGEEMVVVMVTLLVVLLGFVGICCSLWRHGNSSSANQDGFSSHIPSDSSPAGQPLPPLLMSQGTPSPRQQPHQRASAFTPTNNSPHYTLYNN
ncbi:nuclear pore membrane glycoprotein 210-like isoform X3 [Dysidea avara]|uniref:nuclear pore membrane glycoprotein 210-like isoform X3 n=1 Tax=Dysidea avara TaxID=196820 RepID=UPI00331B8F6E